LHTGFLFNTGRQTGGPWRVISLHTILNRYLHHESSNRTVRTNAQLYRRWVFVTRDWNQLVGEGCGDWCGTCNRTTLQQVGNRLYSPQVQRALVFGESRFLIVD
jgi:hypothetical protein